MPPCIYEHMVRIRITFLQKHTTQHSFLHRLPNHLVALFWGLLQRTTARRWESRFRSDSGIHVSMKIVVAASAQQCWVNTLPSHGLMHVQVMTMNSMTLWDWPPGHYPIVPVVWYASQFILLTSSTTITVCKGTNCWLETIQGHYFWWIPIWTIPSTTTFFCHLHHQQWRQ